MSKTKTHTCGCCNGDLPAREIWEANRDQAGDCTGSVDANGRCKAFSDDDLWELETEDPVVEVCGHEIQYDRSGVGHCWVDASEIDCLPSIQEEIAGEIIDGGQESCDDFVASNGVHYRW